MMGPFDDDWPETWFDDLEPDDNYSWAWGLVIPCYLGLMAAGILFLAFWFFIH